MTHLWPIEDRIASLQTRSSRGAVWLPIPNSPQEMAYHSEADELFYGGAAGGGKTDLLVGLAGFSHHHSVVFRQVFPSVRAIIERSREVYNSQGDSHAKDSYNESTHIWRLTSGRLVEFASCQHEKDKEAQRGRPRDMYGFDEITEFSESQYRFITAWNRSTYIDRETGRKQRCRVVATGNPPSTSDGEWVVAYWGPWLDEGHALYPTPPGEIRWVARIKDKDVWFLPSAIERDQDGRAWVVMGEQRYRARSRTFIPAKLTDNPHLADTDYAATIDSLPEPLRSQMRDGLFNVDRAADPWQVIPTAWVKAAQKRWREREQPDTPMTALGGDIAHGGKDKTVLAYRYDTWFAPLEKYPGAATQTGQAAAALILTALGDVSGVIPNVDAIGYGASCVDALRSMDHAVNAVNVAEGSSARDRSGKFGFINLRAELFWKMREALDPESGDDLALPDDTELLADLCSARWELKARGIQVESKPDIKARIGRSPDCGDAVLLALMQPASLLWGFA